MRGSKVPSKKIDIKTYTPLKSGSETTPVRYKKSEMKYIEDLGREVRMCCYLTARLNETYCYCGRAVESDVKSLCGES